MDTMKWRVVVEKRKRTDLAMTLIGLIEEEITAQMMGTACPLEVLTSPASCLYLRPAVHL